MLPPNTIHPLIVAVDDQPELLDLLQMIMPFHGYDIKTARNAVNLFDIISEKLPDIFFLDIHMDKIDGGMLCTLLKTNDSTADIPVIMVSGNENIEDITRECGADGFLRKPFSTDEIEAILHQFVDLRLVPAEAQ